MTLIEVIISLALLGILSGALLGGLAPTVNMEKDTRSMNAATFDAAGQLERALYSMRSGSDITDMNYITYSPHTLYFELNGTDFSADGKRVQSKEPGTGLILQAFVPDAKEAGD